MSSTCLHYKTVHFVQGSGLGRCGDLRRWLVGQGQFELVEQQLQVFLGLGVAGHDDLYWSNLNIKDSLARLRRNQDPANGVTWEVPDDVPEDYLKQMESEHRIKDQGKWIWKQICSRPNHCWDAECMQVAAATMLKLTGREAGVVGGPEEPVSDGQA